LVPFFRETMKNPHVIINRVVRNTVNPFKGPAHGQKPAQESRAVNRRMNQPLGQTFIFLIFISDHLIIFSISTKKEFGLIIYPSLNF